MAEVTKATYWQRGETIDYKNETEDPIEAGTLVSLGYIVGVAASDIPAGEIGALHIEGVFSIPKDAGTSLTIGDRVCMKEGKIQKHADGDSPVGIVVSKPAESATSVLVMINI